MALRLISYSRPPTAYRGSHSSLKRPSDTAEGNQFAVQAAKQAASKQPHDRELSSLPHCHFLSTYTEEERRGQPEGVSTYSFRWYTSDGTLLVPRSLQWKLINAHHEFIRLGRDAFSVMVSRVPKGKELNQLIWQVSSSSPTCSYNNSQGNKCPALVQAIQWHGTYPGEDWQVDFIRMPPS